MKLYRIIIITILLSIIPNQIYAESVDELKGKIDEQSNKIEDLEKEIKDYQEQIDTVGKEANSLKNTLKSLDLSKKKLEANLALTQKKIEAKNLEIKKLSSQIVDKSDRISSSKKVISQSLSTINRIEPGSILENLLGSRSLSEAWNEGERLSFLQSHVRDRIHELQDIKVSLETNKEQTEQKKTELLTLQKNLNNQKKIIAQTVSEKNSLLSSTKNTEENYKKILANRLALKNQFEDELFRYESALNLIIDPNSIPSAKKSTFSWPVSDAYLTQRFGTTEFSKTGFYNGKGHNGIDFRASIGTPVLAAGNGVVEGIGDTGIRKTCLSYGRWILIKHGNGLSTVYAHLSLHNVSPGQRVSAGQVIGYSGNTGYSTGPHLHLGVLASQGVKIGVIPVSVNCRGMIMPLVELKAYLNPLDYI